MFPKTGIWGWICTFMCVVLVFSLFYLGTKPVAVGLFPTPMDKVAHFVTFSLITSLLWIGLFRGHPWVLALFVCGIAGADEVHQIFLPGRSADFMDFAADAVAVFLTIQLFLWVGRFSAPDPKV